MFLEEKGRSVTAGGVAIQRLDHCKQSRQEDLMEEGKPSFTAIGSGMVHAKYLLWDDPPKIFKDPFALAQISIFPLD
jgi:hypothetical protein